MAKTTRTAPVRSADQTTYTWSLSKELKAKLIVLAEAENRPLSNYLTWLLSPQVETTLKSKGLVVTEDMVETILEQNAAAAFRGIPHTRRR